MPSIATQTVEQLGGPGSVLVRQRQDHRALDGLLEQLQRASGEEQDDVLARVWRLVLPHAYAEETVLWPVIRGLLPDGDELTLQVEREHTARVSVRVPPPRVTGWPGQRASSNGSARVQKGEQRETRTPRTPWRGDGQLLDSCPGRSARPLRGSARGEEATEMGVAATDDWLDPDLVRLPAGEVHGWTPGQNSTVCGLQLSRSRLRTFRGIEWEDVQPTSGGMAEAVQSVCRRCAAALSPRAGSRRWSRHDPRP